MTNSTFTIRVKGLVTVTTQITANIPGLRIVGDGMGSIVFQPAATSSHLFDFGGADRVSVEDLTIIWNSASTQDPTKGCFYNFGSWSRFRRIDITYGTTKHFANAFVAYRTPNVPVEVLIEHCSAFVQRAFYRPDTTEDTLSLVIRDCSIDHNSSVGASVDPVIQTGGLHALIENVRIGMLSSESFAAGIGVVDGTIRGCRYYGSSGADSAYFITDPINEFSSGRVIIENNFADVVDSGVLVDPTAGDAILTQVHIRNNYVSHCRVGVQINPNVVTTDEDTTFIVENNYITLVGTGLGIMEVGIYCKDVDNVIIRGNEICNNEGVGIWVLDCTNATIEKNRVAGFTSTVIIGPYAALVVEDTVTNLIVDGNYFGGIGAPATAALCDIRARAVTFTNNYVDSFDSGTSTTLRYGLYAAIGATGLRWRIKGNFFVGAAYGSIWLENQAVVAGGVAISGNTFAAADEGGTCILALGITGLSITGNCFGRDSSVYGGAITIGDYATIRANDITIAGNTFYKVWGKGPGSLFGVINIDTSFAHCYSISGNSFLSCGYSGAGVAIGCLIRSGSAGGSITGNMFEEIVLRDETAIRNGALYLLGGTTVTGNVFRQTLTAAANYPVLALISLLGASNVVVGNLFLISGSAGNRNVYGILVDAAVSGLVIVGNFSTAWTGGGGANYAIKVPAAVTHCIVMGNGALKHDIEYPSAVAEGMVLGNCAWNGSVLAGSNLTGSNLSIP